MKGSNTAILFFSRSAHTDAMVKKDLARFDRRTRITIAQTLITRTSQLLENTGLPVYRFDEHQQVGRGFGERISNAFQQLFDLGYDHVISVGNDTPGLEYADWNTIVSNLEAGRNVIGGTQRKGTYLIGLTRLAFSADKFQNLSWQTSSLLDEILELTNGPLVLDEQLEINHWLDFKQVSHCFEDLHRLIGSILNVVFSSFFRQVFVLETHFTHLLLRAPPRQG